MPLVRLVCYTRRTDTEQGSGDAAGAPGSSGPCSGIGLIGSAGSALKLIVPKEVGLKYTDGISDEVGGFSRLGMVHMLMARRVRKSGVGKDLGQCRLLVLSPRVMPACPLARLPASLIALVLIARVPVGSTIPLLVGRSVELLRLPDRTAKRNRISMRACSGRMAIQRAYATGIHGSAALVPRKRQGFFPLCPSRGHAAAESDVGGEPEVVALHCQAAGLGPCRRRDGGARSLCFLGNARAFCTFSGRPLQVNAFR